VPYGVPPAYVPAVKPIRAALFLKIRDLVVHHLNECLLATAIRLTFAMLLAASATESRRAYKFLTASKIAIGESWIALRIRAGGSFVPAIILRSLLFAANAPNTLERTQ